jgi:hypothetical protein
MAAAEFLGDLSVIETWASLILFPRVLVVALFLRTDRKDTTQPLGRNRKKKKAPQRR